MHSTRAFLCGLFLLVSRVCGEEVPVEAQPLAANVARAMEALEFLGTPLPKEMREQLKLASEDSIRTQEILDRAVLLHVAINPESRVKVQRGSGEASLQQAGFTPKLVKVVNLSGVTKELRIVSPQAGQVYAGMTKLSAERMQRTALGETIETNATAGRFMQLEQYSAPPMTRRLSGLGVEYAIYLFFCSESGKRDATIGFDLDQGSQDLGFRGETAVLFDVRPAVKVTLAVKDFDGAPTTGSFVFRDAAGHIYPPQAKRLAPDFYFQSQIYRRDGDSVLLPPGKFRMECWRGPEYRRLEREITIPAVSSTNIQVKLDRWVNPAEYGFFSGDHHIHGAGCAHYSSPTEGVRPEDMFRQVHGEGLNVGCVLTWGPCFDFQRRFFAPGVSELSEPFYVMKYDLEISGFGSQSLGHVCLLDLKNQTFPGSEGTKTKGWPTWTTPVMRWAKAQGAVTGYAHSGSGLEIDAQDAAKRLFAKLDTNKDRLLTSAECENALLPFAHNEMDGDDDRVLSESELAAAHDRAATQLPNLALPQMNGVGAMEICVAVAEGVCDFISAMDTPRIAEWNMWYHLLNCGFPLKVSGETDFPCRSGERVGQGRVYVKLGPVAKLDFSAWCRNLAQGRSYVSDGFAHALEFAVNGIEPGGRDIQLPNAGRVLVRAKVAFAPEVPLAVAYGTRVVPEGQRFTGDTLTLHGPRTSEAVSGGMRQVEIVVNAKAVAAKEVPADGKAHVLEFEITVDKSCWIALRHFPELHTNPVNVIVGGKPIRVSQKDAFWCIETIEQLWRNRERSIAENERTAARQTFDAAVRKFEEIARQIE